MLNICTIQGQFSAEYINILLNMIQRNISDQTLFNFWCFTDDATGLDPKIKIKPWKNELIFIPGLFPSGERCLLIHPDVVITSGLDEIIRYNGEYAVLRGKGAKSHVIAWKADSYQETTDILEDLYPNCFVSYNGMTDIPKNARMVIFDGKVKPRDVKDGWVPKVWKIGGGTVLELSYFCNTDEAILMSNVRHALTLSLPWLKPVEAHQGHACIVGGGPSLKNSLPELRERQKHGQKIFATNAVYNYLLEQDITADFHVMLDARIENKSFIPQNADCYYASQLAPELIDFAVKGNRVTLWHSFSQEILEVIGDNTGDPLVAGGNTTVGMKSLSLAWILGYREFHLYGFDSSYHEGENHAYRQPLNDNERIIEVEMNGRKYKTAAWMCAQVECFKEVAKALVESGCSITVHGEGLLPDVAKLMKAPRIMEAVYDLWSSPPTYEFITFLCAAEKARISGGYEGMNVTFQPGPRNGFRDDNLPPDDDTRMSMLWRLCVPACKLMASVKDVNVLARRKQMTADFPVGWALDNPVSHYGVRAMLDSPRALEASPRKQPAKPYITITIRECPYWPERNSKKDQWERLPNQFKKMGYETVWLDDTHVTDDLSSWDIDRRAALYQGAAVNLGIASGPMTLAYLSNAPYLVFRPVTEGTKVTDMAFLERQGVKRGDQWGGNGKVVWEDDRYDVILRETEAFLKCELLKTA